MSGCGYRSLRVNLKRQRNASDNMKRNDQGKMKRGQIAKQDQDLGVVRDPFLVPQPRKRECHPGLQMSASSSTNQKKSTTLISLFKPDSLNQHLSLPVHYR